MRLLAGGLVRASDWPRWSSPALAVAAAGACGDLAEDGAAPRHDHHGRIGAGRGVQGQTHRATPATSPRCPRSAASPRR